MPGKHLCDIPTKEVSHAVLVDALVSTRNELIATRAALVEASKEAGKWRSEAEHYRAELNVIRHNSRNEVMLVNNPVMLLRQIHSCACKVLLWEGRERRRTWRDRIEAWWTTKVAARRTI